MSQRREIIISETEFASWVEDGMTVALGGLLNSSKPMALVRQIIRKRVKGLTLIGSSVGGLDVDLLIGAGCVTKLLAPYVGGEGLAAIGPLYRHAAEKGEIEIWELDEGMYFAGLRATALMLPFLPWRGGVGTSYPEVNPDIKVFKDPINQETLLAIPAIEPDIALIHAAFADPYGNVQHVGHGFGDRALYRAAERTVVQVEKIVPNEEIRKDPGKTTIPYADAVVRAPFGAHPFASPGFHIEDRNHIKEYLSAAEAYTKEGDRTPFDNYLNKYILETETHLDYLEAIGIKTLLSLNEY